MDNVNDKPLYPYEERHNWGSVESEEKCRANIQACETEELKKIINILKKYNTNDKDEFVETMARMIHTTRMVKYEFGMPIKFNRQDVIELLEEELSKK